MRKIILFVLITVSIPVYGAEHWVTGKIDRIQTVSVSYPQQGTGITWIHLEGVDSLGACPFSQYYNLMVLAIDPADEKLVSFALAAKMAASHVKIFVKDEDLISGFCKISYFSII